MILQSVYKFHFTSHRAELIQPAFLSIRLQVPDSSVDFAKSEWNALDVDEMAWENRAAFRLNQRHLEGHGGTQTRTLELTCERDKPTVSEDPQRMTEDHGRSISFSRRRRPSSSSSATSSTGCFILLTYHPRTEGDIVFSSVCLLTYRRRRHVSRGHFNCLQNWENIFRATVM